MSKFLTLIMILLSVSVYNMNHTKPVFKENEFVIIFIDKINKKHKNKTKKWRK